VTRRAVGQSERDGQQDKEMTRLQFEQAKERNWGIWDGGEEEKNNIGNRTFGCLDTLELVGGPRAGERESAHDQGTELRAAEVDAGPW
jgi:hypothetical protein